MITWRTVFKNGARKFLRCAIGARKIQARIIPVSTHTNYACCCKLFATVMRCYSPLSVLVVAVVGAVRQRRPARTRLPQNSATPNIRQIPRAAGLHPPPDQQHILKVRYIYQYVNVVRSTHVHIERAKRYFWNVVKCTRYIIWYICPYVVESTTYYCRTP